MGDNSFIPLFFLMIDMLVMFLPIEMMVMMMMWTSVRRETICRYHTQQHATLSRRCWRDPWNFTLC